MLKCNEVTRLYASDAARSASLRKRLALRIHLLMCRHCRRYVRELRAIGEAVRDLGRQAPDHDQDQEALIRRVLSEGAGDQD